MWVARPLTSESIDTAKGVMDTHTQREGNVHLRTCPQMFLAQSQVRGDLKPSVKVCVSSGPGTGTMDLTPFKTIAAASF